MLSTQTSTLSGMGVNISNMMNKTKGDYSCTLLDCDSDVNEEEIEKAFSIDGIISFRVIPKRA
jgi:D-3-phosphoglycerate dehydrogenase